MDGQSRSTKSLIRRIRSGEPGALERLVARFLGPLRRWARGRLPHWARSGVDTEDIVQESLVNSIRNLDTFDAKRQGALRGYLHLAVMNRIRDEIRRSHRQPTAALDSGIVDMSPSPHDEAIAADVQARYQRALNTLNEHEHELVVARVEMRYSYQQIAAAFGKPSAAAARMAVSRALDKIAAAMETARD